MKKKSHVLLELTKTFDRANRKRIFILIVTVALSIMALFLLLSIVKARVQADEIKSIRENGTAATIILQNTSKAQYQDLSQLNYVDEIGTVKEFGFWYQDDKEISTCSTVSKKDFDKMFLPAYENLNGDYPEHSDEVMLSIRTLQRLEIENPEIGMEIPIHMVRYNWIKSGEEDIKMVFRLSGYYTDYVSDLEKLPTAYFSDEFMNDKKISSYLANTYIKSENIWLSKSNLEQQFEKDVTLEVDQQFRVINEGSSQTIRNMVGGCILAIIGISLILLSMNLFIYNIFSLSISRDKKQYGLLKVIGTTPRQIQTIILLQSVKIIVIGGIVGAVLGRLAVTFMLPKLIEKMYLAGIGSAKQVELYSWKLLVLSILLTGLGVLIAYKRSIYVISQSSPLECLKETEVITIPNKLHKSKKGTAIIGIAWRNFTRNRKKMLVTISSLFLGIEVALLSIVICSGLDQTHRIEQNPDFEIGVTKEAVENYLYQNDGRSIEALQGHALLAEEIIETISKAIGISNGDIITCIGSYGTFTHRSESMTPRINSYQKDADIITDLTVQVVPDEWIDALKQYVEKEGLNTDLDTFQNGNGFILLHSHELSEQQLVEADKTIGKPLSGILFEDSGNRFELMCSGYLDTTKKGFPKLNMPWSGSNLNYIVISTHTMETIKVTPVIYNIAFDVKNEDEPELKTIILSILTEANQKSDAPYTYYVTANSDLLAKEQSYILATRIVMGTFSGILIAFAIIGYCNTMITEIIARGKEFAMMRSIGMTKREVKNMMIWEGVFYWGATLGLLLSAGSMILIAIGTIMKLQVSYFVFDYPLLSICIMGVMLLFISIIVPAIIYQNQSKDSIVEQLRNVEKAG
jgi:ABC-type antimicrobial peptide transport system permease subunit